MGTRTCIHVIKKSYAFFVYAILASNPKAQQHEMLIQYLWTTKMFLKRKMKTHYLSIGHMIVQLIWRKEHSPHLDPSITCRKTNYRHFENTSMKIFKKGSFDTPSFQLMFQSYLLRKRMDLYACVLITMDLSWLTIKNATLYLWSQNCWTNLVIPKCTLRLTYMEHTTWCAFEKVMNGDNVQKSLRPFWICCDAFWPYQCACCLSTYDEWCLPWIFGWFCVTLMTSSFSWKTWLTMRTMYVLFWKSFEKLVFMPN